MRIVYYGAEGSQPVGRAATRAGRGCRVCSEVFRKRKAFLEAAGPYVVGFAWDRVRLVRYMRGTSAGGASVPEWGPDGPCV